MPKYLCLQRRLAGTEPTKQQPSPAEMQVLYEQFNGWRTKFQSNLPDLGGRLGAGRLVLPRPEPDGPLIEIKELVGGYMIVSAESLEQAIEIASACPGLVGPSSAVEVIESARRDELCHRAALLST